MLQSPHVAASAISFRITLLAFKTTSHSECAAEWIHARAGLNRFVKARTRVKYSLMAVANSRVSLTKSPDSSALAGVTFAARPSPQEVQSSASCLFVMCAPQTTQLTVFECLCALHRMMGVSEACLASSSYSQDFYWFQNFSHL
jgi:hypothetical protein